MSNLTAIILTKNEEVNIEKCIESIKTIANKIIVVDSYSNDLTVEISERLGAVVYFHEFFNHADQFNWALDNIEIETEWVMRIDADEEITEELRDEINTKLKNLSEDICGVILRRRIYFMGKWIRHGGVYPTYLLRIFRKGCARSESKCMDEHIVLTKGNSTVFEYDLLDRNNKDLSWWCQKHINYSNNEKKDYLTIIEAKKEEYKLKNGHKQTKLKRILKSRYYYALPAFLRAKLYYLYRYYFRLGFLDGNEGRIYHFLQAYWYRFLVDAKIFEYEKNRKQNKN